MLLLGSR